MTPQDFCYWLQGFSELSCADYPTAEQWKLIREHLALTFNKVTPTLVPMTTPYVTPWEQWHGPSKIDLVPKCSTMPPSRSIC